jgi:type III pantothenate kinase
VSHRSRLPFTTRYTTPETLGTDRIAALAGVATLYPNADVLVIDAGSCITYDFMDTHATHHGGAISPGVLMRFRALHEFTGRLPHVSSESTGDLLGQTTAEAIQSGVRHGVLAEIQGLIERYTALHPKLKTVITGGDAPWIEANLKTQIFGAPDLVLYGLNSILELNEVSR